MRKFRVIVSIAAAALMFMGIGYAAWSQQLPMHVGGSFGNFDVTVDSATGNSVANAAAVISADQKAVTLSASGLYPDSSRQVVYNITIKNSGTIPVKLSSYSIYGIRGPVGALSVGITEQGNEVPVSLSTDNTVASAGQPVIPVNGTLTVKVHVAMPDSVGNEYNFANPDQRVYAFTICANFIQ